MFIVLVEQLVLVKIFFFLISLFISLFHLGRSGTAITLVTQYDVKLMHKIEDRIGKSLLEYRVKEKEVLKLLVEVSMTRSQVEIQLDEEDFGEAEKINKRKHRLLEQELREDTEPIKEKKSKKKTK